MVLRCDNLDMALSIDQHPSASLRKGFSRGYNLVRRRLAHGAIIAGNWNYLHEATVSPCAIRCRGGFRH